MNTATATTKINFQAIQAILIDQVKKQGSTVILLLIFGYLNFNRWETCNERLIHAYEVNQAKMIKVIEANTRSNETISQILLMQKK